jgi:antitoxin (DNA-binding transcriptional repressor) of toxin-antitoxin stability system
MGLAKMDGRMKATVEQVTHEAAEYLHRAIGGETVVVYQGDQVVAEIRPVIETDQLRPIGLAAGEIVVPDDFDDALPPDLLNAFEGR